MNNLIISLVILLLLSFSKKVEAQYKKSSSTCPVCIAPYAFITPEEQKENLKQALNISNKYELRADKHREGLKVVEFVLYYSTVYRKENIERMMQAANTVLHLYNIKIKYTFKALRLPVSLKFIHIEEIETDNTRRVGINERQKSTQIDSISDILQEDNRHGKIPVLLVEELSLSKHRIMGGYAFVSNLNFYNLDIIILGTDSYQVFLHEFGHIGGLEHTFEANAYNDLFDPYLILIGDDLFVQYSRNGVILNDFLLHNREARVRYESICRDEYIKFCNDRGLNPAAKVPYPPTDHLMGYYQGIKLNMKEQDILYETLKHKNYIKNDSDDANEKFNNSVFDINPESTKGLLSQDHGGKPIAVLVLKPNDHNSLVFKKECLSLYANKYKIFTFFTEHHHLFIEKNNNKDGYYNPHQTAVDIFGGNEHVHTRTETERNNLQEYFTDVKKISYPVLILFKTSGFIPYKLDKMIIGGYN
jgi:hypothetical protein